MNTLKTLVIGMGLLIVIGLGLLGYGLYRNSLHLSSSSKPAVAAESQPVAPKGQGASASGYFSVELPVPAGSHLDQMSTAGDRVILRFTGGSDGDRIVVVDPHTGQVTGAISLVPQKP